MNPSDIKEINFDITGKEDNVLSDNMLTSSLSSYHYYETKEDQISSIFRGIVKNHAFHDGNKRTALVVLLTLCEENNIDMGKSDDELAKLTIDIAKNKYEVEEISKKLFS
jgi:death-on-curing family protein